MFPNYSDFSARDRSAANLGKEKLGFTIVTEFCVKRVSNEFFYTEFEFELYLEKFSLTNAESCKTAGF